MSLLNKRNHGLRQLIVMVLVISCLLLLTIAGCGANRPKSLTTEETRTLGHGSLIGAAIAEYIEAVGKPERIFMVRHRDSSLGLQGWVPVPESETESWVQHTVESGYEERECLLLGEIRLKLEENRTWPVMAAALIAAGAGVHAITEDTPAYQELRAVKGADRPLGLSNEDAEEWRQRKLELELSTEAKPGRPLFVTWMYGRGDQVTAYNFPAVDDLGVIRSYAVNRESISPAADTVLQLLVGEVSVGETQ